MAPQSGILYVTMQPQPSLPTLQFHDWYNNEHGPSRLRLPFIQNGFRYRASDLSPSHHEERPEWLAIYDVTDMDELIREPYISLRRPPIQTSRERDTMKLIKIDRKFFDLVDSQQASAFRMLEDVENAEMRNVMVAVSIVPLPGKKEEVDGWYREEHIEMLSRIPGWLRSRRFVTATIEGKDTIECVALHEFAPDNGLGGEKLEAALNTPRSKSVMRDVVKQMTRRTYDLSYTFGPAPRDLSTLSSPFASYDGQTKTYPALGGGTSRGAIESYVSTKDGVTIPFKIEGSTDPHAPLIVLCNSILVDHGIWDAFVTSFLAQPQNQRYRIVRYLQRGRSSACGTLPITIDVLAADVVALLDALRVPCAAAVIGVSLGGATALNVGLRYAARTAALVACDTSAKSPAGNSKAWGERIAVAEQQQDAESAVGGDKIVGDQLADMTVRRWFVEDSYDDDGGAREREMQRVRAMVAANSLEGFRRSVRALFEYDMQPLLPACTTKALFVVGSRDGLLPKSMEALAAQTGTAGAPFRVVHGAGHLPMVEKPDHFAAKMTEFLAL
ncbi:MAG: hypothetical protein M1818_007487 [Claussenomyces sp. TS43310]|nr:MAG: hypothetical protein M1818_007487 [Claussenomyces sp. TS43310]